MRSTRNQPFAWQEKKILRAIREKYSDNQQLKSKMRWLYCAITEIDSDFNWQDIKYYTKTISTYSWLSKDFIPWWLKKLEELWIIKIVEERLNWKFKWKQLIFTPESFETETPPKPVNGESLNGQDEPSEDSTLLEDSNVIIPEDKSSAVVQKHIQVVNMLILMKQTTIGNQKEYSSTIRRNSKCAKRMLDTYSLEDIAKALIFCFNSDFPTWWLEAAEKNIQDVKYRKTTPDSRKSVKKLLDKSENYKIN